MRRRAFLAAAACLAACVAERGSPAPSGEAAWSHVHHAVMPAVTLAPGQSFETPALGASAGFDELLASWNLEREPGGAALVHARVLWAERAEPGPWLLLGAVGCDGVDDDELAARAPLIEEPFAVEAPGLEIDVDFLRVHGERPARAAIRVTSVGTAPVVAHRIDVTLSARVARDRAAERGEPRLEPLALDVPFRSQRDADPALAARICSPTSLAMALAFHGVDVPTEAVAARAYDPRHDLYGVWPRAIQTAFELGVPGYLTRFSDWRDVRRELALGRPLVISIAARPGALTGAPYESTAGHLLVVTGLDGAGGVRVNDPAARDADDGRRVYRLDELTACWMERGGTAYVLL